jgi:hypothetical protein
MHGIFIIGLKVLGFQDCDAFRIHAVCTYLQKQLLIKKSEYLIFEKFTGSLDSIKKFLMPIGSNFLPFSIFTSEKHKIMIFFINYKFFSPLKDDLLSIFIHFKINPVYSRNSSQS